MKLATRQSDSAVSTEALPSLLAVLDELNHGVWVVGKTGGSEFLNEVGVALLGPGLAPDAPADGVGGYAAYRAGTDDLYPVALLPLARALAGQVAAVDDVEVRRESDRVLVKMVGRPLVDASGDPAGALIVVVDTTAASRLRTAERELREARTRFQVAQEKAPMGLAMVGLDHRFTDVNAFLCRLMGRSREDLIGLRPIDLLAPDDAEHHRALTQALLADETDDYQETVEIVRGEGDVVSVELTVGLIRDDAGSPLHQIILAQDITARLDSERLVGDLNIALAERGRDLETLNRHLLRSNRDLEQFAYIASHDLSEPLRSVTGYVQLLARRYRGQLDADADEFIDFAVDGVTRMQTLIRDLLAYARADAGGEPVRVECATLVAGVVAAVKQAHPEVVFEVGALPTVLSEEAPLRQVFDNLISNAVKFAPPDSTPHVTITAAPIASFWRFTVSDNGIGIDERHTERIFGMFQRLHPRADYPGTGIGLAICQRVIERLGGTITVESTVGVGTAISFTIHRRETDTI